MKIKTSNTTYSEVEINLPYFSKTKEIRSQFYKVFGEGEKDCISVSVGTLKDIGITFSSIAFDGTIECTEKEFLEAYSEIQSFLNSKI